ncbi:MAG: cytochrome P450 [Actinobacteria bacterium]|nr:cytochrome P450 [Actinomycetota bacterium]
MTRGQTKAAPPSGCPIHFDPLAEDQLLDPYPLYDRMREEAPVFWSDPQQLFVVTRYDDVLAVLRDHRVFSSHNSVRSSLAPPAPEVAAVLATGHSLSPTLTDSDEPVHGRLRGLVNRAFTHQRVAEMEEPVRAAANGLIDAFYADAEADVIDQFGWSLPITAISLILGLEGAEAERLHTWSYHWLKLLQATDSVEEQVGYAGSVVEMQRFFIDQLEQREREPRDDLMTVLLQSGRQLDPPVEIVEAMRIPMNLIIAGHVTVTRAIGNSVALLIDRPEEQARLRDELEGTIEELLRLESPAQGLFRTALEDAVVGGVEIPAGSRLMVHFAAANRDPEQFECPAEIRPEREGLMRHLAFGKGIHVCVGAPLARLELRIALPLLFQRLPSLRYAEPRVAVRDDVFFARGYRHLRVAWDR